LKVDDGTLMNDIGLVPGNLVKDLSFWNRSRSF